MISNGVYLYTQKKITGKLLLHVYIGSLHTCWEAFCLNLPSLTQTATQLCYYYITVANQFHIKGHVTKRLPVDQHLGYAAIKHNCSKESQDSVGNRAMTV